MSKDLPWPILHLHTVAEKLSEAITASEPLTDKNFGDIDINGKPTQYWINQMNEVRLAMLRKEGELLIHASRIAK